jgi:hypothetical protein
MYILYALAIILFLLSSLLVFLLHILCLLTHFPSLFLAYIFTYLALSFFYLLYSRSFHVLSYYFSLLSVISSMLSLSLSLVESTFTRRVKQSPSLHKDAPSTAAPNLPASLSFVWRAISRGRTVNSVARGCLICHSRNQGIIAPVVAHKGAYLGLAMLSAILPKVQPPRSDAHFPRLMCMSAYEHALRRI